MKHIFFSLVIFCFFSCDKLEPEVLANKSKIVVLGHGGSGFSNQKNTVIANSMPSLEAAIDEFGADGVEVDIQMSKEGRIILYHNRYLQELTNCEGKISEMSWEEVVKCRYIKTFFNNPAAEYFVITLESAFKRFHNYDPKPVFSLDTKLLGNSDSASTVIFARQLTQLVEKYDYVENVVVEAGYEEFLSQVKAENPNLKVFFAAHEFDRDMEIALNNNFDGIITSEKNITAEQVKKAQSAGLEVSLYSGWPVSANKSAISKLPDHIQTDNLDYTLNVVKE